MTPQSSGSGGTVRYAIAEPGAIVPFEAADRNALTVVDALFDSLTRWGPPPAGAPDELLVRPAAAVRWSSDDARVWRFELRPEATYHDGTTPVQAADFKFAWQQAVAVDGVGYHLRGVEGYEELRRGEADELAGVDAVDEHTLQVTLSTPNAEFPIVVGHPALAPVPRGLWEADRDAFGERPVGNGPFAMSEPWARGRFVRVAPFDGWGNRLARPSVTEVVFQVFDLDTAYLAFQQGRLDFTELPPGAVADAEERYGVAVDGYTGPGVLRGDVPTLYFLGFDVDTPPFDRPEVRRAVSQAIDRDALAESMPSGNVLPAEGLVPPGLPGAPDATCRACEHDPAAAREAFATHGVTELTLWFNHGGGHERVARQLRRDLRAAGVRLEFEAVDFEDYLDALDGGRAAMFRFGWAADYPAIDNILYPLLHSSSANRTGEANHGGYAAADVDDLLDRARATLAADERRALQTAAADIALNRDQAVAPLFTYRHAAVASDRVEGLVYDPMGFVDLVTVDLEEGP